MATIPPLTMSRSTEAPAARGEGWVTFHLLFVLAVSVLLNILLVLRLAALR